MGKVFGLTISKIYGIAVSKICGVDVKSTPRVFTLDGIIISESKVAPKCYIETMNVSEVFSLGHTSKETVVYGTETKQVEMLNYTIHQNKETVVFSVTS